VKPSLALYKISREDLRAAKVLYEKKLWSQSIFYLQQAVEKATKSLGIYTGRIKKNQIKKIGHNPIKVFVEELDYWKKLAIKFKKTRRILPELEVFDVVKELPAQVDTLDNFITSLGSAAEAYKKLVLIPEEKLNRFLEVIANLEREIETMRQRVDIEEEWKTRKEMIYRFLDIFNIDMIAPELITKFKREIESRAPEMKTDLKSGINRELDLNFCYGALLCLSLILLPHASYSRYPMNSYDPLQIYDEKLPLIKKFDQLVNVVDKVLDKMRYFVEEFSRPEL
jgi:hypothetical protein